MTQSSTGAPAGGAESWYRQALEQGRFLIQRCKACHHAIFYPRMACPHCGAGEEQLAWEEPSGLGTVYSTTVVRRKPEAGGDHNVALIDLAEGVRLMSRVEGIAPDSVRIGMTVRAKIRPSEDGPLVVFVAAGDQS